MNKNVFHNREQGMMLLLHIMRNIRHVNNLLFIPQEVIISMQNAWIRQIGLIAQITAIIAIVKKFEQIP